MAKKTKKASKPVKKASKPAKKAVKTKKPLAKKVVKKVVKPAKKKPVSVKVKAKPVKKTVVVKKTVAKPVAKSKHAAPVKHAAHKPQENRTRYSDRELMEFKNLIDEKLEAARNELKYLNDQINRKGDNGTDDTENKFSTMEDGAVAMEREYLTQMAARQAQYIDHLEKALIRIQNKTYGICRVTGKLIDKDRLRAVPHATLSMEAKLMQHK